MHAILQVLAIGLASNLDNLTVGVAYGIRRITLRWQPNLVVAGLAFVFSCIGAAAGTQVGHYLSPRTAGVLGAVALIGIGAWVLPLRKVHAGVTAPASGTRPSRMRLLLRILRDPALADQDHSHDISVAESVLLGIALSLNCLTNGVPAGLWHLGVWRVAACNAALSFGTLWLGVWFGKRHGAHWLGRKADMIAGVLLILLGIHGVFAG